MTQVKLAESFVPKERIVAVGLLTASDVKLLGRGFDRLWPVDDTDCFSDLLKAIDDADRALVRDPNAAPGEAGSAQ